VGSKGTLADSRWRVDAGTFGVRITLANGSQSIYTIPATAQTSADWNVIAGTGSISVLPGKVIGFGLPGFGNESVAALCNLGISPGTATKTTNVALVNFLAGGPK